MSLFDTKATNWGDDEDEEKKDASKLSANAPTFSFGAPPPAAAAGGGAPKLKAGASPLNLLASFFSSSSSSPQFVALVSKSDMAMRAASARRLPIGYALCKHGCKLCAVTQQQRCDNVASHVAQRCIAQEDAARGEKCRAKPSE